MLQPENRDGPRPKVRSVFLRKTMKVKCPVCGKETEYSPANPYRPFCSEVCRTADLGSWASDEYVIRGEPGSAMNLSPEEYEAAAEHTREVAAKRERSRK